MVARFQFKTDRVPSWQTHYDEFQQQRGSNRWTRFRHGECPICQGARNDCRQSPTRLVHCRSGNDAPNGWKFINEDSLGFGMYAEGEGDRSIPKSPRQPVPKLTVLTNTERDRQFRQIAKHSGLSLQHRAKLEQRGLSQTTIEQWYQQRLVWTWARDEHIPGTSPLLPGVVPKTGKLHPTLSGYAIAIPSVKGEILGAQVKPNDGGGGYFWVSSTNFEGNNQHLDNGETPIGLYGPHSSTLNFVEGYLKSAIAADQYNLTCVGAAGGHWARSPLQLQEIIEATGATTFILNPDGGMLDLKHRTVITAYNRLRVILEKWGHRLLFRWWGQTCKDDGDIDEISSDTFAQAKLVSWEQFKEKLEYDWDAEESFKKLLHSSKRHLDKAARQTAKGFGYETPKPILKTKQPKAIAKTPVAAATTTSAIALWTPQKVAWLNITSETVPTFDDWLEMGSPQLYGPRDQHNKILVELIQKGYKTILLNGTGGDGKTHRAGEFAQEWETNREKIDGSKGATLHFVTPNYRNPDTETVERIPEKVSPAALDLDHSKLTPLGNPHRKRHVNREKPADIPGLCSEDETIQRLQSKGIVMERGVKSSYCQNVCGLAFNCPYLQAKQAQGRPAVIREHISTITLTPSDEAPEQNGDVILIDEAGRTIAPFGKRIDARTHDIDQEIGRFAQVHPKVYVQYKPVIDAIAQGIRRACAESGGDYGLVHAEVMQFLPTLEHLETLFFDCEFQDWSNPETDVWAKDRLMLQQLMAMLQAACNPNAWQDAVETAKDNGLKVSGKAIEGWISPQPIYRIYQAIAQTKRTDITVSPSGLITFTYEDRRITAPLRHSRCNILMDATPNKWELAQKLRVRQAEIVCLTDYRPSFKNLKIKIIQGLGNTCASRSALNEDGTLQRQGQYDIQIRVKNLVGAIASAPRSTPNENNTTGLLDYRKFIGTYDNILKLVTGYCFNDNRGSNRFKECDRLISVSLATANLGAMLTEAHLMIGKAQTLKGASGMFWKWQRESQTNELIQDGFRLRAQHRPNQELEWYVLSNQIDKGQINTLKASFPGCTVEIVPILQICPQAAPKGVQTEHLLVQTLYQQIKAGQNASINSIAQQLGRTKGRLSQIAKTLNPKGFRAVRQSLVLLYQALESKTKLSDLAENLKAIALDYLPAVAEALKNNELSAQEALEQFSTILECSTEAEAEAILSAVPAESIATLIAAFLPLTADGALDWLIQDFQEKLQRMEMSCTIA